MRRLFLAIGFIGWLAPILTGQAAGKTEARLLLAKDVASPGETVVAAIQFRMKPGWHIYWRNAGGIGQPTRIEWQLPSGVTAGETEWPVPDKFSSDGFIDYVYRDQVLLLAPLKLANNLPNGPLELKAAVSWLECEKSCVPGDATVRASLNIGTESKSSTNAPLLEAWQKKLPVKNPTLAARAMWEKPPQDKVRPLIIEWTAGSDVKEADFLPYSSENYEVKGESEVLSTTGGQVRLRKLVEKSAGDWPREITGLLVQKGPSPTAVEAKLALSDPPGATSGSFSSSFWAILPLAFLGGLILNIMPCVLPVIALKILSFVKQSKESPRRVALMGMTYSGGVLASFLVMASLVVAAKLGGHQASWGMQFQNPVFVVAMTILVTLVALNLFGLFEFNLGGSVMGAAGDLAAKEGLPGAFFNGILATILATPCTAPALAPALGFAFAQPPKVIFPVFLTVGLGLAFPYLILSLQPAWLKFLPKPGTWMEKFKVAMGFPMLGTAIWMLSLTTAHFGASGMLWFALFLVVLGFAGWIWGEFVQRGSNRRGLAMAAAIVLVGGFGAFVLNRSGDQIQWQPWSAAALEKVRSEGRPVFVDFTADWCLTCQANKRSSIEIPSVRAKLKEIGAATLLGDYTRNDEAITRELQRFSRAGVPLVLVYPKDPKEAPLVLPEVLTPGTVLEALDKAAGKEGKPLQSALSSNAK